MIEIKKLQSSIEKIEEAIGMTRQPKQAHGFSRGTNWASKKIAQLIYNN